ncbi:MAG: hypothetical protein K0A99_07680 [Desulfoarculaceae bacterium]|nr:hypothetical protein [Desulfoarculaceae bacterium]
MIRPILGHLLHGGDKFEICLDCLLLQVQDIGSSAGKCRRIGADASTVDGGKEDENLLIPPDRRVEQGLKIACVLLW